MAKVRFCSARHDEHGNIVNGKAGDQTGKEVSWQDYYVHPKKWVHYRAINPDVAERIAQAMEDIANNNNIGYDQNQNNTAWKEAEKAGFNISAIETPCETDCARAVRLAVRVAGVKGIADFYTATEGAALMATGMFEKRTSTKYTTSSKYLRRGDILVTKTKGHTGVIIDDGSLAYENAILGNRDLQNGSKGEDVKVLQTGLILLGYDLGKWGADGDFGKDTEAALIAFQFANGLAETGVFTKKDLEKFNELLDPTYDQTVDDDGDDSDDPDTESTFNHGYIIITGNTVNIRSKPNASSTIKAVAYKGQSYLSTGVVNNGWNEVEYGSGTAWISGSYSKKSNAPAVWSPSVTSDPVMIVDLSEHNGLKGNTNDWAKIAKEVRLVILRCGVTRTATQPIGMGIDNEFKFAARMCQTYNIPFGVYYYGKSALEADTRKEARKAYEFASPFSPLFYAYDVEEARLTVAGVNAFQDELRKLGVYKVGIYVAHHLYTKFDKCMKNYDFTWIPRYGKNTGKYDPQYNPAYPCDMHQYSSVAKLPGFADKTVDVNRLCGSKPLAWFLEKPKPSLTSATALSLEVENE